MTALIVIAMLLAAGLFVLITLARNMYICSPSEVLIFSGRRFPLPGTEGRREVGFRTLFNLLGPMTNPAGARYHVNGVFARERCEFLARAHGRMGSQRAMVIHGAGGLDEFSPQGATFVAELADRQVRCYEIRPADFGLDEASSDGLKGGEPAHNAAMLLDTLRGEGGASRIAALMTAAAGMVFVGASSSLREGAGMAAEALDSGKAMALLESLRAMAPAPAKP